ncbi:MAG: glycosyltransferase family 4 protein, partial [Actinobacteria bacterium]
MTRHIEALAAELAAGGHEPRILAPFDPDDAISRRLHGGARPERRPQPDHLIPLGRTVGIPANGAVSNVSLSPSAVFALRDELRQGGYDVLHIHEPVVPVLGWDALLSIEDLPLVGTFHTYSENLLTNGIAAVVLGGRRRMQRLRVRIAVSEAAGWTARRFYGGRYRIIPNGVELAPEGVGDVDPGGEALRVLFIGQAVERKGLPVLLSAFEALREHVPATLTLVGAGPEEVAHMMLDGRGVQALGKVSETRKREELARAQVLCAPSLHGESFGMVLTEGLAAATPVIASDIPGYRDVIRDGVDGMLVAPGDAVSLAESLRSLALDTQLRRARRALRLAARRGGGPGGLRGSTEDRRAGHSSRSDRRAPRLRSGRPPPADPSRAPGQPATVRASSRGRAAPASQLAASRRRDEHARRRRAGRPRPAARRNHKCGGVAR